MDKIIVKNLEIFAYHGVNSEEKRDGQPFVFDITAYTDLSLPCATDNVDDTVSYAKIIKLVRSVTQSEKNDLIERVARRVADALLNEFSRLDSVKIQLKKPQAPIKARFDYVAVEIERTRE